MARISNSFHQTILDKLLKVSRGLKQLEYADPSQLEDSVDQIDVFISELNRHKMRVQQQELALAETQRQYLIVREAARQYMLEIRKEQHEILPKDDALRLYFDLD